MKDANVSTRVEYNVKKEAEDILNKLGIPVSVVINALYKQIIYRKGIPFPLTIPDEVKTYDELTSDELDKILQRSYEQSLRGEGKDYKQVFDKLENDLRNK